jgi:hypothetical protein
VPRHALQRGERAHLELLSPDRRTKGGSRSGAGGLPCVVRPRDPRCPPPPARHSALQTGRRCLGVVRIGPCRPRPQRQHVRLTRIDSKISEVTLRTLAQVAPICCGVPRERADFTFLPTAINFARLCRGSALRLRGRASPSTFAWLRDLPSASARCTDDQPRRRHPDRVAGQRAGAADGHHTAARYSANTATCPRTSCAKSPNSRARHSASGPTSRGRATQIGRR